MEFILCFLSVMHECFWNNFLTTVFTFLKINFKQCTDSDLPFTYYVKIAFLSIDKYYCLLISCYFSLSFNRFLILSLSEFLFTRWFCRFLVHSIKNYSLHSTWLVFLYSKDLYFLMSWWMFNKSCVWLNVTEKIVWWFVMHRHIVFCIFFYIIL